MEELILMRHMSSAVIIFLTANECFIALKSNVDSSSSLFTEFSSSHQPVQEVCQRIKSLNKQHQRLRILLHTDAAQALGKIRVDACDLGVDYLTIVGHKVGICAVKHLALPSD